MANDTAPELKGHAGIATYQVDLTTGELAGRFVLAMYEGAVVAEDGKKKDGSGPEGSMEGTYEVTTYKPGNKEVFATGTLDLRAVGDQGAYAVVWVLHPTATDLPPTMIYDACGLALSDSSFAVGWDNNDYRTHLARLAQLR